MAASLLFSAFSIAAVIGIGFLLHLAFPFLPNAAAGLAFLVAFVIYVTIVGYIAWKIIQRRMA